MTEARVGVFWLVGGNPVIDSTELSRAEDYGAFKIHAGDHYSVWDRFQHAANVPANMEYEEAPRGRVVYNTETNRFILLADKCILKERKVVRMIITQLHLPTDTRTGKDDHYRCFRCLRVS